MPSPKKGQLPLPQNLQGSWLEDKACSMDDLNALGDGGSEPLQEPQDHPQVGGRVIATIQLINTICPRGQSS